MAWRIAAEPLGDWSRRGWPADGAAPGAPVRAGRAAGEFVNPAEHLRLIFEALWVPSDPNLCLTGCLGKRMWPPMGWEQREWRHDRKRCSQTPGLAAGTAPTPQDIVGRRGRRRRVESVFGQRAEQLPRAAGTRQDRLQDPPTATGNHCCRQQVAAR